VRGWPAAPVRVHRGLLWQCSMQSVNLSPPSRPVPVPFSALQEMLDAREAGLPHLCELIEDCFGNASWYSII
jgi:hypothetical protein